MEQQPEENKIWLANLERKIASNEIQKEWNNDEWKNNQVNPETNLEKKEILNNEKAKSNAADENKKKVEEKKAYRE